MSRYICYCKCSAFQAGWVPAWFQATTDHLKHVFWEFPSTDNYWHQRSKVLSAGQDISELKPGHVVGTAVDFPEYSTFYMSEFEKEYKALDGASEAHADKRAEPSETHSLEETKKKPETTTGIKSEDADRPKQHVPRDKKKKSKKNTEDKEGK